MQINRMFENQIINKGEQRIDALRTILPLFKWHTNAQLIGGFVLEMS
jgi:hypothetical protein